MIELIIRISGFLKTKYPITTTAGHTKLLIKLDVKLKGSIDISNIVIQQ